MSESENDLVAHPREDNWRKTQTDGMLASFHTLNPVLSLSVGGIREKTVKYPF